MCVLPSLPLAHATNKQKKRSADSGKNKSAFGAVLRPFKDAVSTHKTRFMEVGYLSVPLLCLGGRIV